MVQNTITYRIQRRDMVAGLAFGLALGFGNARSFAQTIALASWNDGPAKKRILDFVARVGTPGGAGFVPLAERIGAFENDGTLWSEQPVYFQIAFAFDRIRALAPQHPEWTTTQPFKAV